MSFGESLAQAVVTFSARTLPRSIRERYREQWLADLRDAAEVGLNRGQIAAATLACAVTTSHPWPERRVLTAVEIQRRARLGQGLAFGAALLGVSHYASIVPDRDFSGNPPDYGSFAPFFSLATGALFVFALVGTVFALLLVVATRGVDLRVRAAVALFALASCSPLVQGAIDSTQYGEFGEYLRPSALVYLLGAFLTAVAAGLLWRDRPRRSESTRGSLLIPIVGGVIVALSVSAGAVLAAVVWSERRPLIWSSDVIDGPARLSNPNYAEWLSLKNHVEGMISATFVSWTIAGVVFGVLVATLPIVLHFRMRSAVLTTVGALSIAVVAEAGLLAYLEVAEYGTIPPWAIQLVVILGRFGLVISAVTGIAGRRPRLSPSPGASSRARRVSRRAALP
ncbi:MAG TPA: hypothetical protein VHZ98_05460 [Galbitalea sp.]|jgi:hypothetical protein|nr:hypothetical protein [Galbitalea sp.]